MKAVFRDDEILGTVYYEKVVWTFMRRYSPFTRLNMPIEKCNKRSLPFPAIGLNLEQLQVSIYTTKNFKMINFRRSMEFSAWKL